MSAFAFDLPTADARRPHRIHIFGDAHFSYANTCRGCDRDPSCATIVEFIDDVAQAVRAGTVPSLDVHVEFPLYNGTGRAADLKGFDAYLRRDASPTRRARAALAEKRNSMGEGVSESDRVIGVISVLYHKYGAEAYDHKGGGSRVRFHAGDARHEENARAVFDRHYRTPEWIVTFHRCLATTLQVRTLLRVFLYSRDFVGDMAKLFPDHAFRPILASLSKMKYPSHSSSKTSTHTTYVHKIAKQFRSLPTSALQHSVRTFLDRRVDDISRLLGEDLGYDDAARFVVQLVQDKKAAKGSRSRTLYSGAGDDVPPDLAPYAYSAREHRVREYLASAFDSDKREGVFDWPVRVLLMDAYLLCRMLRYAYQAPGGISVTYTGDMHSGFYVRFLRDQLMLRPVVCHARRSTTPTGTAVSARGPNGSLSRCVPMMHPSQCGGPITKRLTKRDRGRAIDGDPAQAYRVGVARAAAAEARKTATRVVDRLLGQ